MELDERAPAASIIDNEKQEYPQEIKKKLHPPLKD